MWEMWEFLKNVDTILKMWEMGDHWAPCVYSLNSSVWLWVGSFDGFTTDVCLSSVDSDLHHAHVHPWDNNIITYYPRAIFHKHPLAGPVTPRSHNNKSQKALLQFLCLVLMGRTCMTFRSTDIRKLLNLIL